MNFRDLVNAYQRLSPRERVMVGIAGSVLVLISLYAFVWEPLTSGQERMRNRIVARRGDLQQALALRDHYYDLDVQLQLAKRILMQEKNFPLLQHLEKTVESVVPGRIASMNPESKTIAEAYREERVELRLNDVTLAQLVELLHRIEKGQHPLRVTRLHVKKTRTQGHFEVTAVVSTLQSVDVAREAS